MKRLGIQIALLACCASVLTAHSVLAQQGAAPHKHKPKKAVTVPKPKKSTITAIPILPNGFRPTCNLDSGSVGFYFFPANLGAKWTMRTISQTLDVSNKVVKCDTMFHFERIVSDSNKTLQGLPVLRCESSFGYRAGHDTDVQVKPSEYYVDDSTVITVVNHSVSNSLNHTMLVNPLKVGASWRDNVDDTIHSYVVAVDEPVTTEMASYPKSVVVVSRIGFGELSKYFVPGVGVVKYVFRGISPREDGTFVATTELVGLDSGDPKRSIKDRFKAIVAPAKPKALPKLLKLSK